MKKLKKISPWLVIIITTLVFVTVFGILNLYFGFRFYTVQSGSMEPVIKTNSLIVIKSQPNYQANDIITFRSGQTLTTHRLIDTKDGQFTTKGDRNDMPDNKLVSLSQVLGKVVLAIPFLGKPIAFIKTQTGFILLIVIPSTIIVYSETLNIKNQISAKGRSASGGKSKKKSKKK